MGRGPRGVRRRRQADADVMVMARCVRARYWRRRALVTNSRVALLISNNASTSWQHLAHIVSVRPRFVSFHRPGNHDLRNLTGGENVRRVWRQELVSKPELLLTIKQCLVKTVSSSTQTILFGDTSWSIQNKSTTNTAFEELCLYKQFPSQSEAILLNFTK